MNCCDFNSSNTNERWNDVRENEMKLAGRQNKREWKRLATLSQVKCFPHLTLPNVYKESQKITKSLTDGQEGSF